MTASVNAKTYTADNFGTNAVTYSGPSKTLSILDDLRLGRVAPKPTTTFSGVGRSSAKLSRTLTLTSALTPTGVAIAEISFSVPVGAAGADVDTMCTDLGAYLSSASFKLIAKNLQIAF